MESLIFGGGYGEGWFVEAQPTSPDITHTLAVVKDLNNISTYVTCAPFTTYMALMQKSLCMESRLFPTGAESSKENA